MRWLWWSAWLAILPTEKPANLLEEFDRTIQMRLENPRPESLGMSRVMIRPSMGTHFVPQVSDRRDYAPENEREREILARMEQQGLQVGLYLFGAAVADDPVESFSYRALKGPGAITIGTPRAHWYPRLASKEAPAVAGQLPDGREMYAVAQRAMKSFANGGEGFATKVREWNVMVRPAYAREGRCVHCHNAPGTKSTFRVGDALGGVIYAYRQP